MTTEFDKWSHMEMNSPWGEARQTDRTLPENGCVWIIRSYYWNTHCYNLAPGLGFQYHIKYISPLLPSSKGSVRNLKSHPTQPLTSPHTNYSSMWHTRSTWKPCSAIRKDNIPQTNKAVMKTWDNCLDFQRYQLQIPHHLSCKCFTSDRPTAPTSREHKSA